jgi:amino acid transporter
VFDGLIANLKHNIDLAVKTTLCGVLALVACVVALAFLCAAAFMWIAQSHGAIAAALVLAGAFMVLALIAVLVAWILHRRKPPPPPRRQRAWWADPALLAAALDVSRVLGRRRVGLAVLAGAFVLGILLNRPPRKPDP